MMNRHISISRSCKKYTPSVATRPVGLLACWKPTSRSVAAVPIGNSEETAQVIETVSRPCRPLPQSQGIDGASHYARLRVDYTEYTGV